MTSCLPALRGLRSRILRWLRWIFPGARSNDRKTAPGSGVAGLTYVIPDLHGRRDLLDEALARIEAHRAGSATIVLLGDYVDKGPDSKGVIERLLGADGVALITLKGNHDAMMAWALRDPERMADWLKKGGDAALASYGGASHVPAAHRDWLERLALMHIDAHRIYVHAGVDPELPLDRQTETTLMWKRYARGFEGGHGALHVVHGHDNDPNGPLLFEGRSNLDTLAWRTGRLVIGIFDDSTPGGPIDFITVAGAAAPR